MSTPQRFGSSHLGSHHHLTVHTATSTSRSTPPPPTSQEWGEKNVLPRRLFLASYSLLNLILFWEVTPLAVPQRQIGPSAWMPRCSRSRLSRRHPLTQAFVRHANTDKGKALRGEAFTACLVANCLTSTGDPCITPCKGGFPVAENAILKDAGTGVWYPWAKGFGQLLNLNCAVMILPVVRSLVMWLHNATSVRPPWYLAWVPRILPLDKNIVFHKARRTMQKQRLAVISLAACSTKPP